jgi:hypothetical protein
MSRHCVSSMLLACCLASCAGCGGGNGDPESGCEPITEPIVSYGVNVDRSVPEGCWLVDENIYVSNAATLRVMPGAVLKFRNATGIEVGSDGSLQAEGSATKGIVLTGQQAARGAWNGITFTNSASDKNVLTDATIEYAGGKEMNDDGAKPFRAAVFLDSSGFEVRARISRTTIRKSAGYGFFFDHTAVVPDFTGNTVTANAAGAGYVYAASAHNLSAASTYAGNDVDLVFLNAAYDFGTLDRSWPALDVPYHVDGTFILQQHLTLAPGARLLFRKDALVKINDDKGGITAVGTVEKLISFAGTEPTAGHWGGLIFSNTNDTDPQQPRSRLEHVTIEHGGSYTFNDRNATPVSGNLLLNSSGYKVSVILANSTVRKSTGWGAWVACLGTLVGDGNSFAENATGDTGMEANCN